MTSESALGPESEALHFSLVDRDPWTRAQRAVRLYPSSGKDGIVRRTIFFTLLAWLPLMLWALVNKRAFADTTSEPLLRHLEIHARFLIALPVLIYGERVAKSVMKRLLPRFISSGVVPKEKVPAFRQVIADVERLRDSTLPWVMIGAVILASLLIPEASQRLRELDWAREGNGLGIGGWWYLCVSRPLLQIFLLSWMWRIILITIFFRRVVKLGLDAVPSHPDGLGGLGFIELLPRAFVPLVFAMSCVRAAYAAHDVTWNGTRIASLQLQAGIFGVVALALCLVPLMVFIPLLKRARRKGLAQYSDFTCHHERQIHQRWIEGKNPAIAPAGAPSEPSSPAPSAALYNAVKAMRVIPCSRRTLMEVAALVALPILAVAALEIPVGELLGKVLKTVF